MSRGKRYNTEPKLNYQKVFAVLIAIAVVIMFIFIMKNVLDEREQLIRLLLSKNKQHLVTEDMIKRLASRSMGMSPHYNPNSSILLAG